MTGDQKNPKQLYKFFILQLPGQYTTSLADATFFGILFLGQTLKQRIN